VAHHLDAGVAARVLVEQAQRARTARAHEGPEEWLRRVDEASDEAVGQVAGEAGTESGAAPLR
jgi:putative membrane protein